MEYLDRNEFNFPPSEQVVRAVKNYPAEELCFYTRVFEKGVKSVVSVRLSEIYGVDEEQIVLGYGGEEILKNVIHYHLRESKKKLMLIPTFSWWYYSSIASEVGGGFDRYPLYEEGDTFVYNPAEIIDKVDSLKPDILLLASPNNPTGNIITPEEISAVLDKVQKETLVVIDEAYASFVNNDVSYVGKLVNRFDNLVIVRTFSKFFGLPGLRMGFAFVSKGHKAFKTYSNKYLGYNRFSESVAMAALSSEEHYRKVADEMAEGRRLIASDLGVLPGFKYYKSFANFVLLKYDAAHRTALKEAFSANDVRVKFLSDPGLESHMRITLGRTEQIKKVCAIVKGVVGL